MWMRTEWHSQQRDEAVVVVQVDDRTKGVLHKLVERELGGRE
jgi:hypothetical protein